MCTCVCILLCLCLCCALYSWCLSDTLGLPLSQHPYPIPHSCVNQISCHLICEHDFQFQSFFFFPVRFYSSCQSCLIICSYGCTLTFVLFLRIGIIYIRIWDAQHITRHIIDSCSVNYSVTSILNTQSWKLVFDICGRLSYDMVITFLDLSMFRATSLHLFVFSVINWGPMVTHVTTWTCI